VHAPVVDSAAALAKAWCNAEHCLPLDDVVRREVWDGSIPIRLELAKQDVSTFEPPMPFYLQVVPHRVPCSACRPSSRRGLGMACLCVACVPVALTMRSASLALMAAPGHVLAAPSGAPCGNTSCWRSQAPRMAYLPLALAAAKAYFANYVPSVSCTDRFVPVITRQRPTIA